MVYDHDGVAGDDVRETRFTFDELGRQTSRTLPLGVIAGDGSFAETFGYNELGQQTRHTSFEGVSVERYS